MLQSVVQDSELCQERLAEDAPRLFLSQDEHLTVLRVLNDHQGKA